MANQRDNTDERQARLDAMIERIRAEDKGRLLTRGIALWTRAEAQRRMRRHGATLPLHKSN